MDPIQELRRELMEVLDRHMGAAERRVREIEARKAEILRTIDEMADEALRELEKDG